MKLIISCTFTLLIIGNIAAQDTLEGKLVKIRDGKLTMTDKEGKLEVTYKIADDAVTTCDGKQCKTSDLGKGCKVIVTLKEQEGKKIIVKIKALSEAGKSMVPSVPRPHISDSMLEPYRNISR